MIAIISVLVIIALSILVTPVAAVALMVRLSVLALGLLALWLLARSRWVDTWLSLAIGWALNRWTDLEVRDYAQLVPASKSGWPYPHRVESLF